MDYLGKREFVAFSNFPHNFINLLKMFQYMSFLLSFLGFCICVCVVCVVCVCVLSLSKNC